MRSIKRGQISIGAARAEDRAPSHDGEYLAVYYKHGGEDYIIEGNGGVVGTSWNIEDMVGMAEDEDEALRWQAEAKAIAHWDTGEAWDVERMGAESRDIAVAAGWITTD